MAVAPALRNAILCVLCRSLSNTNPAGITLRNCGHDRDTKIESDADRAFATRANIGCRFADTHQGLCHARSGNMFGENLKNKVLAQLGETAKEDLVLFLSQIFIGVIADRAFAICPAFPLARVGMSKHRGNVAAA